MSEVIELTDNTFDGFIESNKNELVILDFGAAWCGPCKKIHPIIQEIAEEYSDKLITARIDIGDNPGIGQRFNIISVPQVIILKNGIEEERIIGVLPKSKMVSRISKYFRLGPSK